MRTPSALTALFAFFLLSACAQTVDHRPLSSSEYQSLDFSDAGSTERWWGDVAPTNLEELLKAEASTIRKLYPEAAKPLSNKSPVQNLLAISGGGANGAFGAGLLTGWTKSGKRPQFDIVTGVSTGAIIAPLAFLGSDYDKTLLEIYSSITRTMFISLSYCQACYQAPLFLIRHH